LAATQQTLHTDKLLPSPKVLKTTAKINH